MLNLKKKMMRIYLCYTVVFGGGGVWFVMDFGVSDYTLFFLHGYFLLMSFTVERYYCHGPLTPGDTRVLVQETIDFCTQHNRLFLARPEWMVAGTFRPCRSLLFLLQTIFTKFIVLISLIGFDFFSSFIIPP